MSQPPTCPACGRASLTRHCPDTNRMCGWDTCTNRDCGSNVDRVTGKHDHRNDQCHTCGPVTRRPAR
jgi:hypothetical protein